jgi:hypothetical protein
MERTGSLEEFQELLDRVARTGERAEVAADRVPSVAAWDGLESRGCILWVERGRWWVLPPAALQGAVGA